MLSSLFTDPLFSLQIPSSARDKKQIRGGFIDRQRRSRSRSLADLFEKNEEKNKTMSVYMLCPQRNLISLVCSDSRTDDIYRSFLSLFFLLVSVFVE